MALATPGLQMAKFNYKSNWKKVSKGALVAQGFKMTRFKQQHPEEQEQQQQQE